MQLSTGKTGAGTIWPYLTGMRGRRKQLYSTPIRMPGDVLPGH